MRYTKFKEIKKNPLNEILLDIDFLKSIYKIQSPSGKEKRMIDFITKFVKHVPNVKFQKDKCGNILITKGVLNDSEYYPCLIAHMDEVHDFNLHRTIIHSDDFIFAWDSSLGKRDGLGADDKNGIYIALELLKRIDKLKIFFSVGEEIGLVGTKAVDLNFFNDVGYMLQCDRRGHSDLITFTNGVDVTSYDFLFDIIEDCDNYNYYEARGVLTDVGGLKTRGVNVSGCNISCGYWDEHYEDELTHLPSLENCLNFVNCIIRTAGNKLYEHSSKETVTNKNSYYPYLGYNDFNWDWEDLDKKDDPCLDCEGDCAFCKKF